MWLAAAAAESAHSIVSRCYVHLPGCKLITYLYHTALVADVNGLGLAAEWFAVRQLDVREIKASYSLHNSERSAVRSTWPRWSVYNGQANVCISSPWSPYSTWHTGASVNIPTFSTSIIVIVILGCCNLHNESTAAPCNQCGSDSCKAVYSTVSTSCILYTSHCLFHCRTRAAAYLYHCVTPSKVV